MNSNLICCYSTLKTTIYKLFIVKLQRMFTIVCKWLINAVLIYKPHLESHYKVATDFCLING